MRITLLAILAIFFLHVPEIIGARVWERANPNNATQENAQNGIKSNVLHGIASHGKNNKNAQGSSKTNARAKITNIVNIKGDNNQVVQIAKINNNVDSNPRAENRKIRAK